MFCTFSISFNIFCSFSFVELLSLLSSPSIPCPVCWVVTLHIPSFYFLSLLRLHLSLHPPLFLPLGFAVSDLSEAPDSCLFPAGSHQRHWPYGRNSECALLVSYCFVCLFIFSLFLKHFSYVRSLYFLFSFASRFIFQAFKSQTPRLVAEREGARRGTRYFWAGATDKKVYLWIIMDNMTVHSSADLFHLFGLLKVCLYICL